MKGFNVLNEVEKLEITKKMQKAKELSQSQVFDLHNIRADVVNQAIEILGELQVTPPEFEGFVPEADSVFDIEALRSIDPKNVAGHDKTKAKMIREFQREVEDPDGSKSQELSEIIESNMLRNYALTLALTYLMQRSNQEFSKRIKDFGESESFKQHLNI